MVIVLLVVARADRGTQSVKKKQTPIVAKTRFDIKSKLPKVHSHHNIFLIFPVRDATSRGLAR